MRFKGLASAVTIVLAVAGSPAAAGAVTIGQTGTPGGTCAVNVDQTDRQTAANNNAYQAPSTGGILNWTMTSWSTQANSSGGLSLTMKVFHENSTTSFTAVSHDGPRPLTPSALNTFAVSIAVKAGDLVGLYTPVGGTGCTLPGVTGDVRVFRMGNLSDGSAGTFSPSANSLINVSAQLTPTNAFTLGTTTRNKKKGTASVTVNTPNPGALELSGKGVKAAAAQADSAGAVALSVKATGKQRKTLNKKGKVKVKPTITFTPTGGDASTQTTRVTLKKRL